MIRFVNYLEETIFALATPPLPGALAIFRLSGGQAKAALEQISQAKFDTPNLIKRVDLYKDGQVFEEATAIFYQGPKSFTGEDMVEIFIHGAPLVMAQLTDLLTSIGLKPAQGGEFSFRAFVHRKIDLIQAEAINDLINAAAPKSQQLALLSLKGKTSERLAEVTELVNQIASSIAVSIDYPEYDGQLSLTEITTLLENTINSLDLLADGSAKAQIITSGVKVALIGRPNVGKSTLLNQLVQEDRAIVSAVPGTTRDVIEARSVIEGIPFIYLDTAGIRNTDNEIEQEGIARSYRAGDDADIILLITDCNQLDREELDILDRFPSKTIVVRNKVDLHKGNKEFVEIVATENIDELKKHLVAKVGLESPDEPAFLTNSRQVGELNQALNLLKEVRYGMQQGIGIDLLFPLVEQARLALYRISGASLITELEEEVFARFCVGK